MRELIVDSFAGGGGASTGIELATGRPVDIAINHDPDAILMHKTNHPHTEHIQASVWDVDPVEACAGRPVGLLWASPDCKHFSKAKGGKPVDKHIRGLADYTGREYPKFKQIARCGNAVPPPFAEALVRANLPEWCS